MEGVIRRRFLGGIKIGGVGFGGGDGVDGIDELSIVGDWDSDKDDVPWLGTGRRWVKECGCGCEHSREHVFLKKA